MKRLKQPSAIAAVKGFTLVEVLTVVLLMTLLASLAVPSFNRSIRDNRVLAEANSLVTAVATARSEALHRGRMVSVCPSGDGLTCSSNWSQGWIVYVEKNTVVPGGAPDVDTVIRVEGAPNNLALDQPTGNKWLRFSSRGIAEQPVTATVKPEDCEAGFNYQELAFGISGRVVMTQKQC